MADMILNEGLREHDLEGLVSPLISIDQFESKIDDDAIVVAFYVKYKDPALDLNRFVQKSAVNVLDTEVSPAPTESGSYVVFVELLRNERFPATLESILENLAELVDEHQWKFVAYGVKGVHELTTENVESMVRLQPQIQTPESIRPLVSTSLIERSILRPRPPRQAPKHSSPSMAAFKHMVQRFLD
jgi:hypothetical protein